MEKLSAKRKLYLKLQMQSCIWMTEAERNPFFSNTEEKSEDFVWKHLEECFGEPCHVKDCGVYEEGQIECGTFCVNEKMAQIRPQHHNDQSWIFPWAGNQPKFFIINWLW